MAAGAGGDVCLVLHHLDHPRRDRPDAAAPWRDRRGGSAQGVAGRGHRHDRRLSALDRAGDYGDLPAYFGCGEYCVSRPDACRTQGVERAENGRRDLNGGNRNFLLAKRGDL